MSQLINHPQFGDIRVQIIKNEPWFVAKDVCKVLEHSNHKVAVQILDEDEKEVRKVYPLDGKGGIQEAIIINESGLYNLIFRSNKPEAKKFRKWVTGEVLPAIRKYGKYETDAKAIERIQARQEKKKVEELLGDIRQGLSMSDIAIVARQCHCRTYYVEDVLSGRKTDTYMLQLLYSRSTGNKILSQLFYTKAGAERLIEELRKTP